jgi:hypothetical protein
MDEHIAHAFEMRHFASVGLREVPGFLHLSLADNQFFRHDRYLLDDHLFFADGNPVALARGQSYQRADWLTRRGPLRSQLAALNEDFLALDRNRNRPLFGDDLFPNEDLTDLDGLYLCRKDLLAQWDSVKIMGQAGLSSVGACAVQDIAGLLQVTVRANGDDSAACLGLVLIVVLFLLGCPQLHKGAGDTSGFRSLPRPLAQERLQEATSGGSLAPHPDLIVSKPRM